MANLRETEYARPPTRSHQWDHLNGAESAPFEASEDTKIAVKVIDHRGNELMVVKTIGEALAP